MAPLPFKRPAPNASPKTGEKPTLEQLLEKYDSLFEELSNIKKLIQQQLPPVEPWYVKHLSPLMKDLAKSDFGSPMNGLLNAAYTIREATKAISKQYCAVIEKL